MSEQKKGFHALEWSAILTIAGILLLFSTAIAVTLIAPSFVDPSWHQASSDYQVQMYEVADPNIYVSTSNPGRAGLQYVYHLQKGYTLSAFKENEAVRIISSPELEHYITKWEDPHLKLTSDVLLLKKVENKDLERSKRQELQVEWKNKHAGESNPPHFEILELIDPKKEEAFAITETDGKIEYWAESEFSLLGQKPPYDIEKGAIYVYNPKEYKRIERNHLGVGYWVYDENGDPITSVKQLKEGKSQFISRQELIRLGEDIYRIEGCWYCHTDQTRTLVQDTVLNGSAAFPAPPSSANEYIYQRVTFPGTRRIGPDLSRVGIKRPHRDWHQSHFWSPTSESKGSIMPSFKHFFDNDPAGTPGNSYGVPNYQFEAIFQYLMTKGTRITPPNQAWWLGKDPLRTIDIIEGKKR